MRVCYLFLFGALAWAFVAGGSAFAQSKTATPKPNPAAAKPAEPATAPAQPWSVNCAASAGKTELDCSMVQSVFARASGLRLISVAISKAAGAPNTRLQLSLPHGVALQQGAEVWVDKGAAKKVPIRNADANGSYAIGDVDAELLDSLKKGSMLNTAFKTLDGKRIVLQVSLNGFTTAYSKL